MTLQFGESLLWGGGLSVTFMLLLWVLQRIVQDAGLVDFGWAASIAMLAIGYACTAPGAVTPRVLAGIVGGFWGGRLALHLLVDRIVAQEEDGRYRHLRAHWAPRADLHFLWFFAAQGLLAVAFSVPFLILSQAPQSQVTALQIVGIGVFVSSFAGEFLADRQLARFRADPSHRGLTCRQGLWRYSRHPNYFFEWLIWCGIALIVYPAAHGGWALLAPVFMYVFLTRLTGIPYTEAQALRSRGEDYRMYQRETNAFFLGPWRSVSPESEHTPPARSEGAPG